MNLSLNISEVSSHGHLAHLEVEAQAAATSTLDAGSAVHRIDRDGNSKRMAEINQILVGEPGRIYPDLDPHHLASCGRFPIHYPLWQLMEQINRAKGIINEELIDLPYKIQRAETLFAVYNELGRLAEDPVRKGKLVEVEDNLISEFTVFGLSKETLVGKDFASKKGLFTAQIIGLKRMRQAEIAHELQTLDKLYGWAHEQYTALFNEYKLLAPGKLIKLD